MTVRRRRLLLLAVAVVAGTVLVVRGVGAEEPTDPPAAGATPADQSPATAPDSSVADPGAADPGLADPGHGEDTDGDPVDPLSPTADPDRPAQPGAVRAAEVFASVWSSHQPRWPAEMADLATADLTESLADVDPTVVPARTVTGAGSVVTEVPGWVSVGVPTDAGTVVLHVVAVEDGWLVSAIDWRPER